MCGCATQQSGNTGTTVMPQVGDLTLRVEDMTCSHCADTIRKAVEAAVPGAQVDPNPATKLVAVRGTADLHTVRAAMTVRAAIAAAGYTPSA